MWDSSRPKKVEGNIIVKVLKLYMKRDNIIFSLTMISCVYALQTLKQLQEQ